MLLAVTLAQTMNITRTQSVPTSFFSLRPVHAIALLGAVLLAGACGSDEEPVSVSAPVGINLKAESGDVENNVITVDKSINTESGNPWGAFTTDVDAELGGPPSDIELESLELLLATSSEGFVELREVFDGTVDVQFEMNGTNNFFPAGSVTIDSTTEGRSVSLEPSFDYATVQGNDLVSLMGGSFKVVMSGPAAAGFENADGKAEMQLTFQFAAFE